MGGGNVEAVIFQLVAHAEGDDAGTVAADKVVLAGFQRPLAAFQQLGKAAFNRISRTAAVVWYAVGLPSMKDSISRTSDAIIKINLLGCI